MESYCIPTKQEHMVGINADYAFIHLYVYNVGTQNNMAFVNRSLRDMKLLKTPTRATAEKLQFTNFYVLLHRKIMIYLRQSPGWPLFYTN